MLKLGISRDVDDQYLHILVALWFGILGEEGQMDSTYPWKVETNQEYCSFVKDMLFNSSYFIEHLIAAYLNV